MCLVVAASAVVFFAIRSVTREGEAAAYGWCCASFPFLLVTTMWLVIAFGDRVKGGSQSLGQDEKRESAVFLVAMVVGTLVCMSYIAGLILIEWSYW